MANINEEEDVNLNEEEEEKVEEVEKDEEDISGAEESDADASDVASEADEDEEASEADEEEADASDVEETIQEEDEEGNPLGESGVEGDGNPLVKKTRAKKSKAAVSNISGIAELEANKNAQLNNAAFEEESDEEPEEDEHYLQKFDSEMRDNFILNYHPEARSHNYEEVKALARVTRDGRGIIIDPMHKTIPFLTKYEMTRVLGQRAKQLDSGAKAFVKVPLNVIDGYHIAKLELEQKKIPFIIKRPFPNGGIEYWHVYDLEIL
jgi:DNA-directed RNA polymerase subunit K/omega